MKPDRDSALLQSLLQPGAYAHDTEAINLRETHISWIILTGRYAYKLKKPVDYGFVDYSTLERRCYFCNEELRLNRRLAAGLYLAVVPVTGPPEHAQMDGTGPPIEYAVKMRQFPDHHLFDRMVREGRLRSEYCDRIAERLAAFHASAEQAPNGQALGLPETIWAAAEANFQHLLPTAETLKERAQLQALLEWSRHQYSLNAAELAARRRDGFIRECHGDLHLGNLVLLDEGPTPFDCIEFNPELRWIDVVNEAAFLGMDLEARGETRLAYRFLNRYEALLGDYAGLRLWNFYRMYRSMVRAKVLRLTLEHASEPSTVSSAQHDYRRYLDFATGLLAARSPALIITHGFSRSGKSHVAAALTENLPAIWLRSDVERKRLNRLDIAARTDSVVASGIYGAESTRRTYARLQELARILLQAGFSVVVDATFLQRWQREQQLDLAKVTGADFYLLDVQTPVDVLTRRLGGETPSSHQDPSEATAEVLQHQLRCAEPLTEQEETHRMPVDGQAPDLDSLMDAIRRRGRTYNGAPTTPPEDPW